MKASEVRRGQHVRRISNGEYLGRVLGVNDQFMVGVGKRTVVSGYWYVDEVEACEPPEVQP